MHYYLVVKVSAVKGANQNNKTFPVAMRFGVTPVPIPNTTVKTKAAESTILATVWEDRWLPDHKRDNYLCSDHRTERLLPIDDCTGSQKK